MAKKYTETHYAILVYLIGVLVQWLYFKGYVFHPNNFIVSYGGDPLVIYTDMINHICNGSGIYLDFMNYPYGESIFMTDMQASFTLVFGWINNVVDICDIIPGLVHASIMWLMPLTGMFMYLSFRKLGTTNWVSILFSLLIAYLSPQIIRFLGQLSLAYPFLVPLSIYWFLDLYDRSKLSWKDMFFGFVLFFFMLNNAYTGIIASATLLGGGLILLLLKEWKKGGRILLAGFIPVILGYIIIHLTDPYDDRLKLQWGTFHYNTNMQSLFYPNGSFLYDIFSKFTEVAPLQVESRTNLGLGNVLIAITSLVMIGYYYFKEKAIIFLDKKTWILAGAGLLCLVYAANSNIIPALADFMETYLSELLTFKSSGRMSWVAYYIVGLLGVWLLDKLIKKSGAKYLYIWLIAIAGIWGAEAHVYLKKPFKKIWMDNHFTRPGLNKEIAEIDAEKYQAIYTLPPLQSWNDKIEVPKPWSTQYSALIISAKTGLPIINAQLSRAPISSMTEGASISGDPILPKPRLAALTSDKPILVVRGWDTEMTEGMQYILDNSKYIGPCLKSNLLEMPANLPSEQVVLPEAVAEYIHDSFDDKFSELSMLGQGARLYKQGSSEIIKLDSLPYEKGTEVEFSIWYFLDKATYHYPIIKVHQESSQHELSGKHSTDFYKNWRRHTAKFTYNGGPITVNSDCGRDYYLDELHIQAASDTTLIQHESGVSIYNGFPTQE